MSSNIEDSLVLITSKDDKLKRNFGTGFVIYQDGEDTYVITCDHVLRDVGGIEKVLVRGIAATLVVSGESQGFDLAVLKVQGLSNVSVLTLCSSTEFEKQSFEITGYFSYDQRETRLSKKISGYLGKSVYISSHDGSDHIKSWDLHIKDNDRLKPGYSGSPVIDRMGDVLGIVSHLVGDGSCGLAISIEGIQKVWTEMPSELYKNRSSSHNDDLDSISDNNDPDLINENPSEYLPTKFCLRSLLYLFILLIFMSISIAYSYHFFSSNTWKKAYRELGWIIEMLRAVIAVAVMAGLINIIFPIEFCE
ncbi:serine protease, partial [Dolichospermum sp. LEGE 00246]|uniref:S1 family peptidase n=1 Tax=Dolichospermum sp. LEGE 00246 TaxID=1828605 RepID=UPI001882FD26